MIYDRTPYTPWIIDVRGMEDEEEFEGIYRTTYRDGKECEQFTLISAVHPDNVLLQIRIYKNGDVLTGNLVPVNVMIHRRKKEIKIDILCHVWFEEENMVIKPYPDDWFGS